MAGDEVDRLGADIKSNTLDVDFYKTQFDRIDEIKKHIGRTVMALAIPNEPQSFARG